jgi:hypothetical protein
MGVIYMHSHAPVPRLDDALADLQPLLDGMMAKEASERFQSAEELATALEREIHRRSPREARNAE